MMSGVRTGSGRANAASCQATTILVIARPEKPTVSFAIRSITSCETSYILISFFPVIIDRGYLQ